MKHSLYIIILFTLLSQAGLNAQQTPITSQYLTNGLIINPAYAGSRGALSTNLSYRKQWARIQGAPTFQNMSLHSPINKKEKVSLGLLAEYNTFGVTKDIGIYGFYAYNISLGHGRLSMGLKGGIDLSNTNYNNLEFIDPNDPLFMGSSSYKLPNIGAGFYYYTDKIFIGLSVPSILSYRRDEADQFKVHPDYNILKTYFSTGALITFSEGFKVKPSVLLRYSLSEPLEIDLNTNFIIADVFWIGGSYRVAEKAAVGLIDLQVTRQLKIGYSYDYQTGHLNKYTSGTHEVSLRYEFEFSVSAASPRYF
ncbi:MAG TPA: type IX secretion system membrane protein PorP/SprF [Bacteroidales bacterium]|nr:type IX secretion system membrane protein PorP/SprF [Bacteroidales bacterium]